MAVKVDLGSGNIGFRRGSIGALRDGQGQIICLLTGVNTISCLPFRRVAGHCKLVGGTGPLSLDPAAAGDSGRIPSGLNSAL